MNYNHSPKIKFLTVRDNEVVAMVPSYSIVGMAMKTLLILSFEEGIIQLTYKSKVENLQDPVVDDFTKEYAVFAVNVGERIELQKPYPFEKTKGLRS